MFEKYPDVLSVSDVCEILRIGKRSVYKLLNNHDLSYRRIGRIYHIPKSSVIAFISQDETLNATDAKLTLR